MDYTIIIIIIIIVIIITEGELSSFKMGHLAALIPASLACSQTPTDTARLQKWY